MGSEKAETMAIGGETFWELLEPLEKKLYNFLRRALHFSEDSRDLYQEVVIRGWKYFPSFDRRGSFSSWIFAIAHNEIKSHFRKHRRDRAQVPLERLANDPPAPAVDPALALVLDEAGRLPPRQREVFFLYYTGRFSVAEVAAICGLGQGHVKFILSRGREAVRRALEAGHER